MAYIVTALVVIALILAAASLLNWALVFAGIALGVVYLIRRGVFRW